MVTDQDHHHAFVNRGRIRQYLQDPYVLIVIINVHNVVLHLLTALSARETE